jgi:hypothetical protein
MKEFKTSMPKKIDEIRIKVMVLFNKCYSFRVCTH